LAGIFLNGAFRGAKSSATVPLDIVYFLLTPQERRRRIPATFSVAFRSRGTGWVHRKREKWRVIPEGEKACSICRDGLCNALIRSARLAATGCGRLTPEESSAAIAALRSAMFRHQSAHACGCVPARWVVTVHQAARRDDSGNRSERPSGRSSASADEPSPRIFHSENWEQ
jgi:hypothetical protein